MGSVDGATELAKMFKDRDNRPYQGPQVGIVASPPPDIKVTLGDRIVLSKEKLIISSHILAGYHREIEVPLTSDVVGATQSAASHTHQLANVGISKGQLKFTDTLEVGDQVILIPSTDSQTYFLIDRAVRL